MSQTRPSVLFVCVHNAGRSQMAAAWTQHLSAGRVEVRSAGSAPADSINPAVREVMLEEGIDISAEKPKILTTEAVEASDVVITMGCGDTCPIFPGKRYETGSWRTRPGRASRRFARSATRSADASASCSSDLGIEPARGDAPTA
jgi:arsenate reductase